MNKMPNFDSNDYQKVVEILALIAWKIELQEKQYRPRVLYLAVNTAVAAAENFAVKPFEQKICKDLKQFLTQLIADPTRMDEFSRVHSIREQLRDVIRLFLTQAENNEVRVFSNFLYRFASRLSEISGQSFAGMGRQLDAGEAEILIEIRDELPR